MNDNDLRNDIKSENTYHATTNLNTAIENPQVNINSAMGVNIQNTDNGMVSNLNNNDFLETNQFSEDNNIQNYVDNQNQENNLQFIPIEDNKQSFSSSDDSSFTSNGQVSYEPIFQEKKKPSTGIVVSRELKVMIFIVFVLFLFILVIPYIYDFFKGLQLVITS